MNNQNKKIIRHLTICEHCHCFDNSNPIELRKSCPNKPTSWPNLTQPVSNRRLLLFPVWVTDIQESRTQQFRKDLHWGEAMKCITHGEFANQEEYLTESLLEYYVFIQDLFIGEIQNTPEKITGEIKTALEYIEYDLVYKDLTFYNTLKISPQMYQDNPRIKLTFNPFIKFYLQCQGVLSSKNLPPIDFVLPDIPELHALTGILDPKKILVLLQEKKKQYWQKIHEFTWTNPFTGDLWDFTKTPVIYPHDLKNALISIANLDFSAYIDEQDSLEFSEKVLASSVDRGNLFYESLPKNYSTLFRDLVLKFELGQLFYHDFCGIITTWPNVRVPMAYVPETVEEKNMLDFYVNQKSQNPVDVREKQKEEEAIWAKHFENHSKKAKG